MLRLATTALLALPALPAQASVEREVLAMGTGLVVRIEAADRPSALAASEAAVRAVEAAETRLSVWRSASDVSRINAAAVGEPVAVDAATVTDLRWAFEFGARAGGAFDATAGPLVLAYGLRAAPRWPSEPRRAAAAAAVGREFFALGERAVIRRDEHAALDCDGFGKGIALDRAAAAAIECGARCVWLDFGGQVVNAGEGARPVELAIAGPVDRARTARAILLPAGHSAATSGNGERRRAVDGRPLGHLIDPRTGLPAPDFGSVTVIAPSAALADAAATALFVLGPERGGDFADDLGIRAIFVHRDNER